MVLLASIVYVSYCRIHDWILVSATKSSFVESKLDVLDNPNVGEFCDPACHLYNSFMACSPAVLDWQDIKVLVNLCSSTIPGSAAPFMRFEAARLDLVHALQEFVKAWSPGAIIDNQPRKDLVAALDEFEAAWREWTNGKDEPLESEDIKLRLVGAIEAAEDADRLGKGSFGGNGMLPALLLLALQQLSNLQS